MADIAAGTPAAGTPVAGTPVAGTPAVDSPAVDILVVCRVVEVVLDTLAGLQNQFNIAYR